MSPSIVVPSRLTSLLMFFQLGLPEAFIAAAVIVPLSAISRWNDFHAGPSAIA